MWDKIGELIGEVSEILCGYPLFFLLIGGGLYLFISSGMVSIRRLPATWRIIREKKPAAESKEGKTTENVDSGKGGASTAVSEDKKPEGQISSMQALASVVAATIGLGNIAGVAIALVLGGPGAIFWMWISAIVGMATKFHEGTLAVMYRGKDDRGRVQGGTMHIIEQGLGRKWKPMARFFAIAGLFGTLCIINANQLTEAVVSVFSTPEGVANSSFLSGIGSMLGMGNESSLKLIIGLGIGLTVALVILGGIKRIANVATVLVPFMVGIYFVMVLYIIVTNIEGVPAVIKSIFTEAFNLKAGFGAFAGIAIIGARRAALVNDAGVGTATIMHGSSSNTKPVREGLIAMLSPSIDSGLVCTLTAIAILLCGDISSGEVKGLEIALDAFAKGIPMGDYLLMLVAVCFALSSMFSYSVYGRTCASYLLGSRSGKYYVWAYILSLVVFSVVPLSSAVGLCDIFYALMAFPTMFVLIALSRRVHRATREYFAKA